MPKSDAILLAAPGTRTDQIGVLQTKCVKTLNSLARISESSILAPYELANSAASAVCGGRREAEGKQPSALSLRTHTAARGSI